MFDDIPEHDGIKVIVRETCVLEIAGLHIHPELVAGDASGILAHIDADTLKVRRCCLQERSISGTRVKEATARNVTANQSQLFRERSLQSFSRISVRRITAPRFPRPTGIRLVVS